MIEDYRSAQRAGQRAYRANVARGQSPYLAVLDDILTDVDIVAQEPLGLVDIPAESIVGTKTAGRHTAFASNFMPLLDDDTEFAVKWSNLCDAHLEEGIHTPIIAFEYLNKFYVQEGNKRVSVLKYYEDSLLYTFDAADDQLCVDLGGQCINKKNKQHPTHIYNRLHHHKIQTTEHQIRI